MAFEGFVVLTQNTFKLISFTFYVTKTAAYDFKGNWDTVFNIFCKPIFYGSINKFW